MRLDKFLANENFGTRKHVKKMIKSRLVKVDEIEIIDPGFLFNPEVSVVKVEDKIVTYNKSLYFLLNKPKDYMCSNIDELYPSVLRLLPEQYFNRLRIVGRLDADTTGVLILTDDGKLNNFLANPKYSVGKTYKVTTNHPIPLSMVDEVSKPVDIGRGECSSPAEMEIIEDKVALITLYEGKYHEVKRIFHHFSLEVMELDRISFHDFTYGDLKPGEYREIKTDEIDHLLKLVHKGE